MTLSRQTLDFIRDHAHEDIHALALQTPKYPDVDMPAAILQIAGKQAAANKIPSWAAIEGILYPRHLSMLFRNNSTLQSLFVKWKYAHRSNRRFGDRLCFSGY